MSKKICLLNKDSSRSRAMLAKLRRGAGKELYSVPETWEIVIDGIKEEKWRSKEGEPTKEEKALHTALTLYAVHKQGNKESMSVSGKDGKKRNFSTSLGGAAAKLISPDRSNEQAIIRRFNAVATASNFKELVHHARGLVQLLKAKNIQMDYPQFADDLFRYQLPDNSSKVCLEWGEDFYHELALRGSNDKKENGGE
jgi:CRISPR system Cascade subunit CasB